jgi:hypothetical protein
MTTFEFTDTVMSFCTEARHVNVLFKQQAANYEVTIDNSNFASLVAAIAQSWRGKEPVKVKVQGAEVISVETGS